MAMANRAAPLMKNGGSIISMSYLGAVKAVPGYNVMGVAKSALESATRYLAMELGEKNIRVNSISGGPLKHCLQWLLVVLVLFLTGSKKKHP